MLAAMSAEEREAWFARRDEDDRIYVAWRCEADPDYQHPWEIGS